MAKYLRELIQDQLAVSTRPTVETASVGTSVSRILVNRANRVALTFVNTSANTIYVLPVASVSVTNGIRLASGGTASFNWRDDLDIIAWEWFAVASGASSSLTIIQEITI